MSNFLEFSELMSARFCHDISGAIGAVNNSIDFLDSTKEDIRKKAVELIRFSSSQSIGKVIFFRRAYGVTKKEHEISLEELRSLIEGFFYGVKVCLSFDHFTSEMIEGDFAKLILNAVIIASGISLQRGNIGFSFVPQNKSLKIIIGPDNSNISEDLLMILAGKGAKIEKNTRNIQFFYSYEVAKLMNYAIDIESSVDGVSLCLVNTR